MLPQAGLWTTTPHFLFCFKVYVAQADLKLLSSKLLLPDLRELQLEAYGE